MNFDVNSEFTNLRQQAQEKIKNKFSMDDSEYFKAQIRKLIQEFDWLKTELHLKNEELAMEKASAEAARKKSEELLKEMQKQKSDIELQKTISELIQIIPPEWELESKIDKLEEELEFERLRNFALNTFINGAERDLNIAIRKHSGDQL